ncbi:MAG: hypothetical protein QG635_670 [Bacteroidota bacterium]|nr:hypothetical protein [Bacteroidota bacterium]
MVAEQTYLAITAAFLLCMINVIAAAAIAKSSLTKDWDKFSKMVWGSFAIRFVVMLGLFALGFYLFKNSRFAFSMSFLVFYFVFILLEILYINKSIPLKRENR